MTAPTAPSSIITNCTSCPLYINSATARATMGMPYFGVCAGTGRLINAAAAASLPGSPLCPARHPDTSTATVDDAMVVVDYSAAKPRPFGIGSMYAKPRPEAEVTAHIEKHSSEVARPDSCKRCIFFQPKELGTPGTPSARYDLCQRFGKLIKPKMRAETAKTCGGGVKGTPAQMIEGRSYPLLPYYTDLATVALKKEAVSMPADADYEAMMRDVDLDALAAAKTATVVDDESLSYITPTGTVEWSPPLVSSTSTTATDAAIEKIMAMTAPSLAMDPAILAMIPEPVVEVEPDVVSFTSGTKVMPKRVSRTGIVCLGTEYAIPVQLPEGAIGLVAVRADSKASNFIWLPYFDVESFPEAVRADIPAENDEAYFSHSDLLYKMAVAYATDSVCALWGDAGVGKTEAVEHIARITRQPFKRISIKWATQVDDLIGRWTLRDGSMEWIDGRFTRAWRLPYLVCIDEPNTGKDEVWQALRAPFDGAQMLVLDEKDGEQIPRHPFARVFTAMNPGWDARFSGTRPLNDADVDRMQHIYVPYPPAEVEKKILMAKAPNAVTENEETVDSILKVARDVRSAVKAKTIRISFGLRKVLRWAEAMQYMTPLTAFDQAVTAWMEPNEARQLRDIADAYFRE